MRILAPLTKLTKKNLKFAYDEACENSFIRLMKILTCAPVLVLPDGTKLFTVYTDAYGTGLGAVQMQEGRVVCYGSR